MKYLECPICNKKFKSLSSHVHFKHKITSEEFYQKYPNCKLVSNLTKRKTSKTCKEIGCGKWKKGSKLSKELCKAISERTKGEKNPFYGQKHTKKTRRKMSENHADFTGENNPFKNWLKDPDNREKWHANLAKGIEKRKKDKKRYKKLREKRSISISKAHAEGKLLSYGRGHKFGYFYSNKFRLNFYYQSSYELKFLKYCEENEKILKLNRNKTRVPYMYKGIRCNYIPDFIINESFLVEIKPITMVNFGKNKHKIRAGKRFCKNNDLVFVLITEKELQDFTIVENLTNNFTKNTTKDHANG